MGAFIALPIQICCSNPSTHYYGVQSMSCLKIFGKVLTKQQVEDLKGLLESAGCDPAQIEVLNAVGIPDPDCDDEVIIVMLTPAVCEADDLEKNVAQAQNGGRRVICIWPKDTAEVEAPPAAKKY